MFWYHTNVRDGDNWAELVGMRKNQEKVHKGEPYFLVVEFFLLFKIHAWYWSWREASGKDLVTQKWYNQGLDFHNRELFMTGFQQIEYRR